MRSRLLLPAPTPSAASPAAGPAHDPPIANYSPAQAVFHGEYVELFAPAGAEILAPHAARITALDGRTVLLEHPDGERTWFDGLVVNPALTLGAQLATGAVLGTVARGGSLKAAHVRWGALTSAGKPQDPRTRVATRADALLFFAAATLLIGAAAVLFPSETPPILED